MGCGITLCLRQAGVKVTVLDCSDKIIGASEELLQRALSKA